MKIALFLFGVFIFFFSFFQTPQPSRTRCVQSNESLLLSNSDISCDSMSMMVSQN